MHILCFAAIALLGQGGLAPRGGVGDDAVLQEDTSVYVLHFISRRETIETVYRHTTAVPE